MPRQRPSCAVYQQVGFAFSPGIFLVLLMGILFGRVGNLTAQGFFPQFELSDAVRLDEVDSTTRTHLERIRALLAEQQWDEAIDGLQQLIETHGRRVVGASPARYISLAEYCHLQLAALPDEALALYRQRVDPQAQKWLDEALADRNETRLRQILEQMFASSVADDALWAMGEMAQERGDLTTARACWEALLPQPNTTLAAEHYRQITEHGDLSPDEFELFTARYQRDPSSQPPMYVLVQSPVLSESDRKRLVALLLANQIPASRLAYPDTDLPLPEIWARLILLATLEGDLATAQRQLAEFARIYPQAEGNLGGRHGNLSQALEKLVASAKTWPPTTPSANWSTFAKNFARNPVAIGMGQLAKVAWGPVELGPAVTAETSNQRLFSSRRVAEDPLALLSYHPVVVGNLVLWSSDRYIHAVDIATGKPAWPGDPSKPAGVIYDNETNDSYSSRAFRGVGVPRYTLTVADNRVYARMGSQVTGHPLEVFEPRTGALVCLDLAAEGRLMWRSKPDQDRSAFEGPPVVYGNNLYLAMRRADVRPQSFVVCLDAETGAERWRTLVCAAESPAGGQSEEISHGLLTLAEGTLYANTNLGAVAAISAEDGRTQWVRLYPRARAPSAETLDRKADHFYRDLNPCLFYRGIVFVAPSDCRSILALDATTGQLVWETPLAEDVIHLLGVTEGQLVASGNKLWVFDIRTGKALGHWPEQGPLAYGRGAVAGDGVFWTSRDRLYQLKLANPLTMSTPPLPLAPLQASGGNVVVAQNKLLLATASQLFAFELQPPKGAP
jgi:outer membrane protein assembly factor BamB/tetratricopeptide (TPR) repeat protein